MFTAEIDGIDGLERSWANASRTLRRHAERAVERAVEEGAAEARAKHTYRNRTGRLERSTVGFVARVQMRSEGGRFGGDVVFSGEIVALAPYAKFVDKGTSRSRAYPFMYLAYNKARQVFEQEMGRGIFATVAVFNAA